MRINKAFTLAEVLVTLSIIGVVAAMTIPPLITKYNKMVWVNQLKKSVSTLENGYKMILVSNGVDDLGDTDLFRLDSDYWTGYIDRYKKYFKIISGERLSPNRTDSYKNLDGVAYTWQVEFKFKFADGSTVYTAAMGRGGVSDCDAIKQQGGNLCYWIGSDIIIDVNSEKGPNQWGRDVFAFILSQDGHLYPFGGKDYGIALGGYWRNPGMKVPYSPGMECAGRVIEEGWKMNY